MLANKTFAVMQPYFLPYLGYFQLMQHVDTFIFADDYQYSKGGWINRNQILSGDRIEKISLPIKSNSVTAKISDREIAQVFNVGKIMRKFEHAYGKNDEVSKILHDILNFKTKYLSEHLINGLTVLAEYLNIKATFLKSSEFDIPVFYSASEKIIYLSRMLDIPNYVNSPGGQALYDKNNFKQMGVDLNFLEPDNTLFHKGRFSIAHTLYESRSTLEVQSQLRRYKIV